MTRIYKKISKHVIIFIQNIIDNLNYLFSYKIIKIITIWPVCFCCFSYKKREFMFYVVPKIHSDTKTMKNSNKHINSTIIFIRYTCSVCCDLFLSSTFLFIKYIEHTEEQPTVYLYLIFSIPTIINYVSKIIISSRKIHNSSNSVMVSLLTLLSAFIIMVFCSFEEFILEKFIFYGLICICIFNIINSVVICLHEKVINIPVERNFDSLRNRLHKIFVEEVPNYSFAWYLSIFKNEGLKPYFYITSILFIIDTIIICIFNMLKSDIFLNEVENIEEKNIYSRNVLATLFILKIFGEVNETFLYFTLASKLREHGHLIYFFSAQFLLKIGYKKIDLSMLKKFTLLKTLLYISSLVIVSNIKLLNRKIFSLIILTLNGITNQIAFATYDYCTDSEFIINLAEFSIFILITLYLLSYKLIMSCDSLSDLIFMSNVRL